MDLKSVWSKVTEAVSEAVAEVTDAVSDATADLGADPVDGSGEKTTAPLQVLDVSERSYEGRNSIAVMLSAPLDPAVDFQDYLNVTLVKSDKRGSNRQQAEGKTLSETDAPSLVEGAWLLSKNGRTLWFTHTEPEQRYQVLVYKGLTAADGGILAENTVSTVDTRSLDASVNFDTQGAFLTTGMGKGLPVVTVNVPHVNIDFFRVKPEMQQKFLDDVSDSRSSWWNTDYVSKKTDLVYSGRYDLAAEHNRQTKRSIDVEGIAELEEPGIYLAIMLVPGEYSKKQLTWFTVTDIGLHARQYQGQLDIYASSLKSGKAMSGVKVSLLDKDGKVLDQQRSSPEGLVSLSRLLDKGRLLVAEKDGSYSLIEMRRPALDLSAFDLGQRPFRPNELFVYGPRDLYRPGEVAIFSALMRDYDGKATKAGVLQAELRRPDGSTLKRFAWSAQEQGYYEKSWQIPTNAPTGQWELVINGAGLAGVENGANSAASNTQSKRVIYPFKVEEFLPERMRLSFASEAVLRPSDAVEIKVQGDYLYGAPASGNRLSTKISTNALREAVPALKDYVFGDIKAADISHNFTLPDVELAKDGSYTLKVDSRWQKATSPIALSAISSLYESGGRPVTRMHNMAIWPEGTLPGIRPSFKDLNPESNSKVSVDLVIADQEGNKLGSDDVQLKLIREDRNYFWVYSEHGGWHYEWTDKEFAELDQSIAIDAGASKKFEFSVEWGSYRLEVTDANTGRKSSLRFYAGYNWYERWERNQAGGGGARPDEVSLAFDKENYKAGETAKLSIQAPEAGEALVLVESDKPLWSTRIPIGAGGAVVDIPIADGWNSHNLYASVVVLKPASEKESITPKRSMGLIHLPLNRSERELGVAIVAPEKVLPNKTIEVEVAVKTSDGKPAKQAHVTLSAVDVGVLSITDFATPDPHDFFFGQRRYSVDSLDMYDKIIELSSAQRATLRFGGDSDIKRGGKQPQSDVQIVSLFSGAVALDDEGKAMLPLTLPDFDGQLRLMAVAFGEQDFGANEKEMTVAAPVISQISMPRFLAYGDKSRVALDVTNLSGKPLGIHALLQTDTNGVSLIPRQDSVDTVRDSDGLITLADKARITLSYDITSKIHSGTAAIKLALSAEGIEPVNKQWNLGLRPAYPAITKQAFKTLNHNEGIVVDGQDISDLLEETVVASVSASNQVDLNLADHLKNLLQYPYGCLEQTASRIYPLIYANSARQSRLGIQPVTDEKRLEMIQAGFDRIASLQLQSFGYGLWGNHSSEEHYLTAYVADMLLTAREQGYAVQADLLENTLKRLREYLNRSTYIMSNRYTENGGNYSFAYKAYAAYVLARANVARLGDVRRLSEFSASKKRDPLALMHVAIALKLAGDQTRSDATLKKALLAKRSDKYVGDYGSEIRDKAMMIHLMLKHKIATDQVLTYGRELGQLVKDQRWFSTQERNALFLAGVSLDEMAKTEWQGVFRQGAEKTAINASTLWRKTLSGAEVSEGLSLLSKSDQPLLTAVTINGYGKDRPAPMANGVKVERAWYTTKGKPVTPTMMEVGDLYLVHVRVTAEKQMADGLLVDLLPAGLELENQNLKHAVKIDDLMIDGQSLLDLRLETELVHQEYRDDRYVAALNVSNYRPADVFYLVRAVTPGEYVVPPSQVEDMYQPERRAVGNTFERIVITQP